MNTYVHSETCTCIFVAALSITAKNWRWPWYPSTTTCQTNYSTPVPWNTNQQQKELLMHATNWMNFRELCWVKKSKHQKFTHCLIPFIRHTWNDEIIEMEKRLVKPGVKRGERRAIRGHSAGGRGWCPCGDGNFLYFDCINTNIMLVMDWFIPTHAHSYIEVLTFKASDCDCMWR